MVLPEEFGESFRLDFDGVSMVHIPLGWKYSPVLCQRNLEYFMFQANLLGQDTGVVILHYLHDFMVVGGSCVRIKDVGELSATKSVLCMVLPNPNQDLVLGPS